MKYFVPAIFRGWCIASSFFAVLLFPSLVLANGPDLSVSKSCVIASPQTIKCDVVVTNIGTVPTLPQFTITDTVTATPVVNYLSVGGSLATSCSPGPQQINNVSIVCSVTGSLAVGASGTAIFDFSMPTGGEFQNCASTTLPVNPMAPPDSNSVNNTDICTTLTVDPPTPSPAAQDLSTEKVCAVNGAQSILCTITITNVGGTTSSNPFTLSDVVTANNTVNLTGAGGTLNPSCSPGAQVINNVPINCTINSSLAPNASGTVLLSFTMPQGGQFENCATVATSQNAAQAPDSNSSNNSDCATLTVDGPPPPPAQDLSTDKVCAVNGAQSILCTITITNVGGTTSSNPFTLSDVVTANNTVNLTGAGGTLNPSCSPGAQVINNVPINCTINSALAPNASGTVLLSFTMPQGGQFENCATVATSQNAAQAPDSNAANNKDCATLTVEGPPPPPAQDLSADKVCEVNGAQSILCTITITNVGGSASSNPFTLSDVVTANNTVNLTGAGGTLNPSCSPGAQVINNVPINCTINSSLAPNASGTVLLSFTMPQGGQFENCATVATSQNAAQAPDSNAANNKDCATLTVEGPPPPPAQDLSADKVCEVNGAQSILCTITITNVGGTSSSNPFTLSDVVTANNTVNLTGAGGTLNPSCSPGAQVINNVPINCTINSALAPNASGTVLLSFTMPQGGQFENCATVATSQNAAQAPDSNSSNNSDCATLIVTPPNPVTGPDLSLNKSCVLNGDQGIRCTVTMANLGGAPTVAPITLTDVITASSTVNYIGNGGTIPFSCTPGPQIINGVPINCTANISLAANTSETVFFDFTMPAGGSFSNCISGVSTQNVASLPDTNASNNTNICSAINITGSDNPKGPDLSATKICSTTGASIDCTVTVTNIGDMAINTAINLTDLVTGSSAVNLLSASGSLPIGCTPGSQQINGVPINCTGVVQLQPGAQGNALFSFMMPAGGEFQNCASVVYNANSAIQPDINPANNTNICTTVTVTATMPDLELKKVCELQDGQGVTCKITYTNVGNATFVGSLSISDQATGSSPVQFIGSDSICATTAPQNNNIVSNCSNWMTVPPNGTGVVNLSYVMPLGGNFDNCVSGTFNNQYAQTPSDPNAANNTNICISTLVVPDPKPKVPDLSVGKTCNMLGGFVQCVVTYTNVGDTALAGPITFSDVVSGSSTINYIGVSFTTPMTCTPTPVSQQINGQPLSCTLNAGMNPGEVQSFDMLFSMPAGGRFSNCVSATSGQNASTQPDNQSANNTDICTTLVVPGTELPKGPDLSVAKSCQEKEGQLIHCTISVTNVGDANSVAPLTLADLATGTSQVDLINISSSHPLSCSPTPPVLINNVPLNCSSTVSLAPSQVFTADFVYSMPTGGRFYNCVSADSGKNAANPGDTNTVNNTNICTTVAVTSSKADTGTITIIKDARPNHAQDFNFTSSSAAIKPFTLDDDSDPALPNQTTFSNLAPGLYSFTEATVSGWSLAGIECSSGVEYKTDQATGTVSLVLSANSNVSCTFFNEQRLNDTSQICGIKFNDLNGNGTQDAGEIGLPGWQITAVSVKPILIESTTTNIKGEYCFTNLPVGNYQLVESPQAPWQQTFPANGNPHLVTLAAGQKVTGINFGNTIPGGSCSPAMQGIGPGTLANGNFEAEQFTLNTPFSFENESLVTGWETTQADGLIEFWSSGYQNVPAYNGNQFIEVNAHTGATIMQNFTATPGSTVTISFAHRGRRGFPNQMQVAIGPMGGLPVTLGTYTGDLSNWTVHTVSYTFPNNGLTSYVIGFTAMDTTAGGNFLDAISMIDIACETLGPPTDVPPIDRVVLDFLEDRYSDFFRGKYTLGSLDGYNYRFYEETNTYMAIDGGDRIFLLGSFTDDMVIFLGTKNDLAQAISKWERGPVSDAKLFSFAEATYPEIFPGEYVSGRLNQFDYRFYPQSGNYLAVDNAGMIYVLGPYTNNVILNVGPVEAFRSAILGQ